MSATLVSNNVTIKISSAVTASQSTGGGGGTPTLYTVPASSYLIFQWMATTVVATNYVRLVVDGNLVYHATATYQYVTGIYAGPGAVIAHHGDGAGASVLSGVLFANSP